MNPARSPRPSQAEALCQIARALNSTLELPEILDRILGMTLDLFAAQAGSILLLEEGCLRIAAARGLSPEVVERTRLLPGEGIAGWVAATGEGVLLHGPVKDPRFTGLVARQEEIASSLCVPMRDRRQSVIGALTIRRRRRRPFSRRQLDFLASVADQAALALENSRLYQAQRLKTQELEAVLAAMADAVLVVDAQGRVARCNPAARALLGEVAGQPVEQVLASLPLDHVRREALLLGLCRGQAGPVDFAASPLGQGGLVLVLHDRSERERAERMKSEFLSSVTHELRTPLAAVLGFLELLLARDFPPGRRARFLGICLEEGRRLQQLIEELLTSTRLASGRFTLRPEPLRLDDLAAAALRTFQERHPEHSFHLRTWGEIPPLWLDRPLMTQAIANLLSNAVKYSPQGGPVEVAIEADDRQVQVSVRDHGIGIPEEHRPYLFERFYRVDNALTRKTGGTGLGLANTKDIIEGHGGSIWIESCPGPGTLVRFVLPRPPN
ncbi:MAG TPA: ATP-binding protein [Candidatus Nitrosotenuis sp.]|nr:ATP-binding protein [Candidatus Nitrosotenuis sp.]